MKSLFCQNHPKGLYLLFFVEMWERFCYYGMRAILVLYMIEQLGFSVKKAGSIYGLYTGLVYLTPLIGGYIADRYTGQQKSVLYGGLLIFTGLIALSFNINCLFYTGLCFIIFGNGFFKPNISTILGKLYNNKSASRDSGFTIFYMGINLGALFSPLVCGTLAIKYGYRYGFLSAAVGMLFGLMIYSIGRKKLLKDAEDFSNLHNTENEQISKSEKLTTEEKRHICAIFLIMVFSVIFWVAFEQAGSSMTLFANYSTNRIIGTLNFEIPTSWFQSLNPLYIIIFAPVVSALWSYLAKFNKEPSEIDKFIYAMGFISASFFLMFFAAVHSQTHNVSVLWLGIVYLIQTIAELCISPVGLSLVSKLAPVKFASLMMGIWFLSSFFGNMLAGFFASFYEEIQTQYFFLCLATLTVGCAVLLILIRKKLQFLTK